MRNSLISAFLLLSITYTSNILAQDVPPMVAIQKDGLWTAYDTNNDKIFSTDANIVDFEPFDHGYAMVKLEEYDKYDNPKHAVIDLKGDLIDLTLAGGESLVSMEYVNGKHYFDIHEEWYEVARHKDDIIINTDSYYMSIDGNKIPNKPYYQVSHIGGGWLSCIENAPEFIAEGDWLSRESFLNNIEMWNLETGKKHFDFEAERIGSFQNGYFTFVIDEKWGVIDIKGKIILEAKYDQVGCDLIPDYGYIEGVIDLDYDLLDKTWENGVCAVKEVEGNWGLVNTRGKWLTKTKYKKAIYAGEGFWSFMKEDETWILVDSKGNEANQISSNEPIKVFEGGFVSQLTVYKDENGESYVSPIIKNTEGEIVLSQRNVYYPDYQSKLLGNDRLMYYDEYGSFILCDGNGNIIQSYNDEVLFLNHSQYSYGLAAIEFYDIWTETTTLGYLAMNGEWAIEPGVVVYNPNRYDEYQLPVACDGFIYSTFEGKSYFYTHRGELLRMIDINDYESFDRYSLLQPLVKTWMKG